MSHRSHGCLRCRQRRVKCDEGRPSCQRCIWREELCVGYRDDNDLNFKDETARIVQKFQLFDPTSCSQASVSRSTSARQLNSGPLPGIYSGSHPMKTVLGSSTVQEEKIDLEEQITLDFMDKFVIYPCEESSTPGFLEHLPCLFREVNVKGRYALRWAVQASAFADISKSQNKRDFATKALEYYGNSLVALEKSLGKEGKEPDDYDLMTVVMLDIFESVYLPDQKQSGSHAQGMAHILRLRGYEQFHEPRGWGLFRVAHHRLQKERLAKRLSPLPESQGWLEGLNDDVSFLRLERGTLRISDVCERARSVLRQLTSHGCSSEEVVQLAREMYDLDQEITEWRQRPEWSYKTLLRSDVSSEEHASQYLPERIEVHRDIWMAYEWNYHRTARVILHQQLLQCLVRLIDGLSPALSASLDDWVRQCMETSTSTIRLLSDKILATVPQSMGDVNALGQYRRSGTSQSSNRAIGSYLLLWPLKTIASKTSGATEHQKWSAAAALEGVREHTSMKSHLGALSSIIE